MDRLVIHRQRMPLRIVALVVSLAVELFDVEVLHIRVKRRESPGHVLVVPGHR